MSKVLDVNLSNDDLALHLGRLILTNFMLEKKVRVLEARVDELDPPTEEG